MWAPLAELLSPKPASSIKVPDESQKPKLRKISQDFWMQCFSLWTTFLIA
jgi:hypothetical protein